MTPKQKAFADLEAVAHTAETSSSIVSGHWVGLYPAKGIIYNLCEGYDAELLDHKEVLMIAHMDGANSAYKEMRQYEHSTVIDIDGKEYTMYRVPKEK